MNAAGTRAPSPPRAVGDAAPPLERRITQVDINRYADATGDFNPIHVDPDYAATGPFGKTIGHGLMTLAYAAEMLNRWTGGRFDEAGEIEVTFIGPVFVEDTIRLDAEVTDIPADGTAICVLTCTAGDRRILVGTVRLLIQDDKEASHGA
jgi:3-hydroxybutyryl-CoA dehydratase